MPTIGVMACYCCGKEIPVKENATGTLGLTCPWCDLSAYAKKGTEALRLTTPRVKRSAPAPEEKQVTPAPPEKKPAPAAKPPAPWMR